MAVHSAAHPKVLVGSFFCICDVTCCLLLCCFCCHFFRCRSVPTRSDLLTACSKEPTACCAGSVCNGTCYHKRLSLDLSADEYALLSACLRCFQQPNQFKLFEWNGVLPDWGCQTWPFCAAAAAVVVAGARLNRVMNLGSWDEAETSATILWGWCRPPSPLTPRQGLLLSGTHGGAYAM